MSFDLQSHLKPAGDQPKAISELLKNFQRGISKQVLLGVTGSGKTFTVANFIQQTQLPTLIISHNKTLAAQLYQEFKELFPKNKVSYFVSYYDFYQPEAYLPSTDTYIAKETEINDLIDKLRLEATTNLFSGDDNIIVASVSCIYNIGDPIEFSGRTLRLTVNKSYPRRQLFETLISLFYRRFELEFKRSTFRVRGETVEIWPSYQDWIISLTFAADDKLLSIIERHPYSGKEFTKKIFTLYPAKQYVGSSNADLKEIFKRIRQDCDQRVEFFKKNGQILEAHRLQQRVDYDLEMIQETGYVNGIENYSIYFDQNRQPGDPPYTLIDYFISRWADNFLTIIDESHVTIPQIGGMYQGDQSRKQTLIDFGFRLPTAFDNRPLKFKEFYQKTKNILYLSATPSGYEIQDSHNTVVEQIIRPTGLIDPPITVKSSHQQINDLIYEIKKQKADHQRTLVITLTKRMAEDLSAYLADSANTKADLKVAYLHSDIDTLERSEILDQLRRGDFDVLVGVNLLREGLDLPEVGLVAIIDADQQGFLRSRSSLIQIMGRASRNLGGQVILYADRLSPAMAQAIKEVNRRRRIQLEYNQKYHLIPQSIHKSIRPPLIEIDEQIKPQLDSVDPWSLTPPQRKKYLSSLRQQMRLMAADLNFEEAIRIRDQIRQIEAS